MNDQISSNLEQRTFASGTTIFTEGQPRGAAFIIKSGKVEISKMANNQKVVLTTLEPDCIFGETSFIDDLPRSATAVAVEPTVCFLVPERLLQENFEKSSAFIKMLMRLMVSNLRDTSDHMIKLAAKDANATSDDDDA
ncbi:MAG: cyclic nucleotide-binding domain-containing protein [Alphaproteobacteria bacterium]|nr:cyclic nucleotide-binding domain-containing protein [Alphaproteobacteria bacterium]